MWNFIKTFYQDICFLLSVLIVATMMGGCSLCHEPGTSRVLRASHLPSTGFNTEVKMAWFSRGFNSEYAHPTVSKSGESECWGSRSGDVLITPAWVSSFSNHKDWPDLFYVIEREPACTGRVTYRAYPEPIPYKRDAIWAYYRLNRH